MHLLFFIASIAMASTNMSTSSSSQNCGDDLMCYFSDQEIEAAYGMPAEQVRRQNWVAPIPDEDSGHHEQEVPADFLDIWPMGPSNAPVYPRFISGFRSCVPGCVPGVYGTYGSRPNFSCHNSGRALDLMNFACGGTRYTAYTAKYRQLVACMRPKMVKILYGDAAHRDHAHFSIGCTHPNGTKWW